jgi:hypothetical protein
MNKLFFLIAFSLTSFVCFSQLIDELPKDENGKLNFSEVVLVDSVSKDELFLSAKQFFAETFKNSKEVIQMDDKDAGIIIGKAWGDIVIKVVGTSVKTQMWFTIKIQAKEGRYRYEIYDIFYKSYPNSTYGSTISPAEATFDKNSYYKKNGQPRDIPEKYKEETLTKVNGVAGIIKDAMKKTAVASSKGDW